jgi:hypothetical protein
MIRLFNIFSVSKMLDFKKASMALFAATVLISGYVVEIPAATAKAKHERFEKHRQKHNWEAILHVAKMTDANQIVMQMEILNKPVTSYANAVYQIYALHQEKWVQVYTNKGARLITNKSEKLFLEPEVIKINDIENRLGKEVDLSELQLKTVTTLRYDIKGKRDEVVQFEQKYAYRSLAETNMIEIASNQKTPVVVGTLTPNVSNTTIQQKSSQFSLSIEQKQPSLSKVIARVSLKEKQGNGYAGERYIGDFRYKLKKNKSKSIQFVKGPKVGDRAIVRLFSGNKKNSRLLGYSEFEILAQNSAVTLVIPEQSQNYGILRTVYGVDTNQDYRIDRSTKVYDYFTQVIQTNRYQDAQVKFLSEYKSINLHQFEVVGLPLSSDRFIYPASLEGGAFALANRKMDVFSSNIAEPLTVAPGQLVKILDTSATTVSIYEVNKLIVNHQEISFRSRDVNNDDNDDENDDD